MVTREGRFPRDATTGAGNHTHHAVMAAARCLKRWVHAVWAGLPKWTNQEMTMGRGQRFKTNQESDPAEVGPAVQPRVRAVAYLVC